MTKHGAGAEPDGADVKPLHVAIAGGFLAAAVWQEGRGAGQTAVLCGLTAKPPPGAARTALIQGTTSDRSLENWTKPRRSGAASKES